MSAQTQTPTRLADRRIRAARRRAADARRLANLYPTTHNEERAQELEAGLHRMETEARA
ncbi:MAG TPA: hypothetical protein VIQ52_09425 [Arthrobacter sp.]